MTIDCMRGTGDVSAGQSPQAGEHGGSSPAEGERSARFSLTVMLTPGITIWALVAVSLLLAAAGLGTRLAVDQLGFGDSVWWRRAESLFNVDAESNVPTWFQGAVLLLCAGVLWTIATSVERDGGRYVRHWRVLALAFLYLSIDEVSRIHEIAIPVVRRQLDLGGVLHFAWFVAALPLVAIFALAYLRFLWHLPARTRWWIIGAGAAFVLAAAGLELPGGLYVARGAGHSTGYIVVSGVEELLEGLAVLAFLSAIVRYANDRWPVRILRDN